MALFEEECPHSRIRFERRAKQCYYRLQAYSNGCHETECPDYASWISKNGLAWTGQTETHASVVSEA